MPATQRTEHVAIGGVDVPYVVRTIDEWASLASPFFRVRRCAGYAWILPFRVMCTLPASLQRVLGAAESILADIPVIARSAHFAVIEFERTMVDKPATSGVHLQRP